MRIILKAFLSGGPHEGAPGDFRDVDAEQAEQLIAAGAAVLAPPAPAETDTAVDADDAEAPATETPDTETPTDPIDPPPPAPAGRKSK